MRYTELTSMRDTALVSAYHAALQKLGNNAPFALKKAIIQSVIIGSAPRFYCSFEEASRICSLMIRKKKAKRTGLREEMYKDLSDIVKKMLAENDIHTMRIAVMRAIESPAPKWYIGVDSAIRIINRSFKKKRNS